MPLDGVEVKALLVVAVCEKVYAVNPTKLGEGVYVFSDALAVMLVLFDGDDVNATASDVVGNTASNVNVFIEALEALLKVEAL